MFGTQAAPLPQGVEPVCSWTEFSIAEFRIAAVICISIILHTTYLYNRWLHAQVKKCWCASHTFILPSTTQSLSLWFHGHTVATPTPPRNVTVINTLSVHMGMNITDEARNVQGVLLCHPLKHCIFLHCSECSESFLQREKNIIIQQPWKGDGDVERG